MWRSAGVWLFSIAVAGTLSWPQADDVAASSADDALPRAPAPDFSRDSARPVLRIASAIELVVRIDGQEQRLHLGGVYVPQAGSAHVAAQDYLTRLLEGETVYVVPEATAAQPGADDPVRSYVYRAPDGLFINLELIRLGYARVAPAVPPDYERIFRAYEQRAQRGHKGVWRPDIPPSSQPTAGPAAPAPVASAPTASAGDADDVVYVTEHGQKYHRADCQYIKKGGGKALRLSDARQRGYTPCSRCKPPK